MTSSFLSTIRRVAIIACSLCNKNYSDLQLIFPAPPSLEMPQFEAFVYALEVKHSNGYERLFQYTSFSFLKYSKNPLDFGGNLFLRIVL